MAEDAARTLGLVTLTAGNLGLVWLNVTGAGLGLRAFGSGLRPFLGVAVAATAVIGLALVVPGLRGLLHLAPPPAGLLAAALGAALAAVGLGALAARRWR